MRCVDERYGFFTRTEIDLTNEAIVFGVFPDQEGLDNAHMRPIVVLNVAFLECHFVEMLGISVELAVKLTLIPDVPLLFVLRALP